MATSSTYRTLRAIALTEFRDVVLNAANVPLPVGELRKLRLEIADGSLVNEFTSASGRYS